MIASNSKLFTSLAVGIALDECGFPSGVDTRIKDVVPEYELMDAKAGETVTFADALSHCTGLPRHDHYTHNTTKTLEALVRIPYSQVCLVRIANYT
jgi:CubicO group peptidase (beta-lactamase class C family)